MAASACRRPRSVVQSSVLRVIAGGLRVEEMERVLDALRVVRCGASASEEELHALAAQAFAAAGIDAQHEARLGPRCRIDFLCGNVGVEIKKSRPERGKLIAQLTRYAGCEQVAALVVVAPRGVNLPKTIGGKPAAMLALERLWGIWLP